MHSQPLSEYVQYSFCLPLNLLTYLIRDCIFHAVFIVLCILHVDSIKGLFPHLTESSFLMWNILGYKYRPLYTINHLTIIILWCIVHITEVKIRKGRLIVLHIWNYVMVNFVNFFKHIFLYTSFWHFRNTVLVSTGCLNKNGTIKNCVGLEWNGFRGLTFSESYLRQRPVFSMFFCSSSLR